jgi:hypothetical protein
MPNVPDLTPEERQRIYQEEKARSEAQEQIKKDARAKKTQVGCIGCLGLVALIVVVAFLGSVFSTGPTTAPTASGVSSTEPRKQQTVSNDAELLLSRCGPPSLDDSTDKDKPRPPIPSRWIEYKQYGLRVVFIPIEAKVGDPPPYKWRVVGVTNISNKKAVPLEEAVRRMPCWKPK